MRGDRRGSTSVPGSQAHDHNRAADEVQVQEDGRQLGAPGGDHDADPQENQPRQAEY